MTKQVSGWWRHDDSASCRIVDLICYTLPQVSLVYKSQHGSHIQFVIQASLVIRDLTLRVFTITRFRGKKAVRKLYSNFAVTVYGGGVTVWRAHQLVTSYQYQCEREC
jgi:hypothetical protein